MLRPSSPKTRVERIIYLSPPVMAFVQKDDLRSAGLLAELEAFVGGDVISVSMIPREAENAMMGLLAPTENGFFDYRSRAPRPGLRLIGGFARKDHFIGLGIFLRPKMVNEAEWRAAIRDCDLAWCALFNKRYPMMTGVNPSDYLSNNFCVD